MQIVKQNSKELLAKLLATENIMVQRSGSAKTASFNLKSRVLVLPIWQGISDDLGDMLVGHETGHALDTPIEDYPKAIEKISKNVFGDAPTDQEKRAVAGFLNIIEDARIDKRQKRRYPGLRRNYLKGFQELLDRDFFGLGGQDISSLIFIDKANLYLKGPANPIANTLSFSQEEKEFLTRAQKLETFSESVALTEDIYQYSKKKMEEMINADPTLVYEGEGEGEMGDVDDFDFDFDSDGDSDSEGGGSGSGHSKEVGDEDSGEGDNAGRFGSPGGQNRRVIPRSKTEEAYAAKMQSLAKDDKTEYIYVNFPNIDWKKALVDYKYVLRDWGIQSNFNKNIPIERFETHKKAYRDWKTKENNSISFMVSEFERKKAADIYSRTQTAKTGVLDMDKIHSYRYNEDLFKRMSIIPRGKNHGFVMFVDWSGSMSIHLRKTVEQLLSICLFCKRIQVPFEVYGFKDSNTGNPFSTAGIPNSLRLGNVVLRNFLSSRMKEDEYNYAASVLWSISRGEYVSSDSLGGTPLLESIILAPKIVNDFAAKNKLEIVNTIFLTDGEGNRIPNQLANSPTPDRLERKKFSSKRYLYNDKETGKTYDFEISDDYNNGYQKSLKKEFFRLLKDKTRSNLVGFFLFDGSLDSLRRSYDVGPDVKEFWRDNKFYPVKTEGYDEYYVIDVRNLESTNIKGKLNIKGSNVTQNFLYKEFGNYRAKSSLNKVLLRRFVNLISGEEEKKYKFVG